MALKHPTSTDGITVDYINQLLATAGTGATVTDMRIIDAKTYGEQMVSTAGRVAIEVDYSDDTAPDLPNRLVLKLTRAVDEIMAPFYANEVGFYRGIRPELAIEAPRCFGGDFSASTTHFGLLLEDLGVRGVVEAALVEKLKGAADRPLLDHHRPQHRLLDLHRLRRHALDALAIGNRWSLRHTPPNPR